MNADFTHYHMKEIVGGVLTASASSRRNLRTFSPTHVNALGPVRVIDR